MSPQCEADDFKKAVSSVGQSLDFQVVRSKCDARDDVTIDWPALPVM